MNTFRQPIFDDLKIIQLLSSCLAMMLFEKIFSFFLTKETAPATTAGFIYCTGFQEEKFQLEFSGYSEKLLLVVETTLKTLRCTLEVLDGKLFEMLKQDLMKSSRNILLFSHCLQGSITSKLLQTNFWAAWDYESEIDKITIVDVQRLAKMFFSETNIQVLLQGNIEGSNGDAIVNLLNEYLMNDSFTVSRFEKQILFIEIVMNFIFQNCKPDTRGYQLPLGTNVVRCVPTVALDP